MAEINENDRTDLVAYLDGELGEEAAQAFEARLSRNKELRAEAEALKRTWEMLDFLPRAEPSASFTHRTLERLAVQSTGTPVGGAKGRLWAWGVPAGWAAAALIALFGGLFTAHLLWPTVPQAPPSQLSQQPDVDLQIVRDLEVIRNKRLYDHADDIDFVLSLPEAFDDEDGGS